MSNIDINSILLMNIERLKYLGVLDIKIASKNGAIQTHYTYPSHVSLNTFGTFFAKVCL